MAMNIAVDDYAKGQNVTTWVKVRSNKENHIRLAEYLTKGRLVLVEGTLSSSLWTDKTGRAKFSFPLRRRASHSSILARRILHVHILLYSNELNRYGAFCIESNV